MPIGLTHLDSDLCWCDPIVEVDENGEHVLLHRQVIWNWISQYAEIHKAGSAKTFSFLECAKSNWPRTYVELRTEFIRIIFPALERAQLRLEQFAGWGLLPFHLARPRRHPSIYPSPLASSVILSARGLLYRFDL
jgi:hypothetical protein